MLLRIYDPACTVALLQPHLWHLPISNIVGISRYSLSPIVAILEYKSLYTISLWVRRWRGIRQFYMPPTCVFTNGACQHACICLYSPAAERHLTL